MQIKLAILINIYKHKIKNHYNKQMKIIIINKKKQIKKSINFFSKIIDNLSTFFIFLNNFLIFIINLD